MFDVQRAGLRTQGEQYFLVKNMAEPELGYARVPEQEFYDWLDTLERTKNKRRSWWRFYHYTDVGNEEYRMNMYGNFLTLINLQSDISEEVRARFKAVLDNMEADDWRRFTKKHEDLFNEVWDKYTLYAKEAKKTGQRIVEIQEEDVMKLLEEMEKEFL